jgi:hypothetical protein
LHISFIPFFGPILPTSPFFVIFRTTAIPLSSFALSLIAVREQRLEAQAEVWQEVFGRSPGTFHPIHRRDFITNDEDSVNALNRLRDSSISFDNIVMLGVDFEMVSDRQELPYNDWVQYRFRNNNRVPTHQDFNGPFARWLQISNNIGYVAVWDLAAFDHEPLGLHDLFYVKNDNLYLCIHDVNNDQLSFYRTFGKQRFTFEEYCKGIGKSIYSIEPFKAHIIDTKYVYEIHKSRFEKIDYKPVNNKLGTHIEYCFNISIDKGLQGLGQTWSSTLTAAAIEYLAQDAMCVLDLAILWIRHNLITRINPSNLPKARKVEIFCSIDLASIRGTITSSSKRYPLERRSFHPEAVKKGKKRKALVKGRKSIQKREKSRTLFSSVYPDDEDYDDISDEGEDLGDACDFYEAMAASFQGTTGSSPMETSGGQQQHPEKQPGIPPTADDIMLWDNELDISTVKKTTVLAPDTSTEQSSMSTDQPAAVIPATSTVLLEAPSVKPAITTADLQAALETATTTPRPIGSNWPLTIGEAEPVILQNIAPSSQDDALFAATNPDLAFNVLWERVQTVANNLFTHDDYILFAKNFNNLEFFKNMLPEIRENFTKLFELIAKWNKKATGKDPSDFVDLSRLDPSICEPLSQNIGLWVSARISDVGEPRPFKYFLVNACPPNNPTALSRIRYFVTCGRNLCELRIIHLSKFAICQAPPAVWQRDKEPGHTNDPVILPMTDDTDPTGSKSAVPLSLLQVEEVCYFYYMFYNPLYKMIIEIPTISMSHNFIISFLEGAYWQFQKHYHSHVSAFLMTEQLRRLLHGVLSGNVRNKCTDDLIRLYKDANNATTDNDFILALETAALSQGQFLANFTPAEMHQGRRFLISLSRRERFKELLKAKNVNAHMRRLGNQGGSNQGQQQQQQHQSPRISRVTIKKKPRGGRQGQSAGMQGVYRQGGQTASPGVPPPPGKSVQLVKTPYAGKGRQRSTTTSTSVVVDQRSGSTSTGTTSASHSITPANMVSGYGKSRGKYISTVGTKTVSSSPIPVVTSQNVGASTSTWGLPQQQQQTMGAPMQQQFAYAPQPQPAPAVTVSTAHPFLYTNYPTYNPQMPLYQPPPQYSNQPQFVAPQPQHMTCYCNKYTYVHPVTPWCPRQ